MRSPIPRALLRAGTATLTVAVAIGAGAAPGWAAVTGPAAVSATGTAPTPSPVPPAKSSAAPTAKTAPKSTPKTTTTPAAKPVDHSAETAASAQAKKSGKAVLVDALTTDNSTVTANTDGTFTWNSSLVPVRVKKGNGWVGVDTTLAKNPDGTISPKAAVAQLVLSGGGRAALGTITTANGEQLALTWPANLPAPTLNGATALYPAVLPGVDLQVTATEAGGFSEVLIVKNAAAAANPALKTLHLGVATKGVTLTVDASGNTQAVDAAGNAVFTAPAPRMWDSSTIGPTAAIKAATGATTGISPETTVSGPTGPGANAKTAPIGIHTTTGGIDLVPDPSVLVGSGVHYPVYADPSYSPTGGLDHWAWVQECYPGAVNFDNHPGSDPGVGYMGFGTSCHGRERGYYDVAMPPGIDNSSVYILPGTGLMHTVVSYAAANGSHTTTVHAAVTGAIGTGTSWGSQPCPWDIVAHACSTGYAASATFTTPDNTPNWAVSFDITTAMQNAAQRGYPDLTMGLFNANESDANSFVRFATTVHTTFTATYDFPPTVSSTTTSPSPNVLPGTPACGPGWLGKTDGNSATFTANVSSPTTGANDIGLGANFWVQENGATTISHYGVGGDTRPNQPIRLGPIGLADGHSYTWWADAYDHYIENSAQLSPCSSQTTFNVDQTSPNQPIVDADQSTYIPTVPTGVNVAYAGSQAAQSAKINVSSTDTGPNPSGIRCFEYLLDGGETLSIPNHDGACVDNEVGSGSAVVNACGGNPCPATVSESIPVPNLPWGTHILRMVAVDGAGNFSAEEDYSFYVPDNPYATPRPGDINGDGIPDMLKATPDGNLRIYQVGQAPAAGGTIVSAASQSPDAAGWNNVQITARGSMHGLYVDDLFAHKPGDADLYLYLNNDDGQFSAAQQVAVTTRPGCGCDWSKVTSIAAIGWADQGGVNSLYHANSRNPTYLLAVAPVNADGTGGNTLWLYPYKTVNTLGNGINIGTAAPSGTASGFDWGNQQLLSPGDNTGDGLPDLWTRDTTNGTVYQFASVHNANGTVDLTALGGSHGATVLATGMTNPTLSTSGDLDGDGHPDLWGADGKGNLLVWLGNGGGFNPAAPSTTLSKAGWDSAPGQDSPVLNYQFGSATMPNGSSDVQNGVEFDTSGSQNNGTLVGGVTLTHEHDGAAAHFDGSTAYVQSTRSAVDTSKSYSIAAWAKMDAGHTGGNFEIASQDGVTASSTMYGFSSGCSCWWMYAPNSDTTNAGGAAATTPSNQPYDTIGVWHYVVMTFDAGTGQMTLYVDGQQAATATNTTPWTNPAKPFIVGRALYNGAATDFFPGGIDDVQAYDRTLNLYEVAEDYNAQRGQPLPAIVPQGTIPSATVPAAVNPAGPGCLPTGPYGTVNSLNPTLQVIVSDADPGVRVHADFALHDVTANTDVITMGGAGSASTTGGSDTPADGIATGSGTVGVVTPTLLPGHTYQWRARTDDGTNNSDPNAGPPPQYCHFVTGTTGTAITTAPNSEWKLNEGSGGTAGDTGSPGGNPATLTGNVTLAPGGYALMDGATGENLASAGPAIDTSKSFTVSAWAKLNDLNTYYPVAAQNGNTSFGFWLGYDHNLNSWALTTVQADANQTAWYSAAGPAGSAQAGVWTHLVGTFNATIGRLSLYVNGALQPRQDVWPTPFTAPGQFMIGNDKGNGALVAGFKGGIADVRTYQQAVTPDQALWLYHNTGFTQPTGLAYAFAAPTALTSADGTATTACSTNPASPAVSASATPVLGANVGGSGTLHGDFELRDVTNPQIAPSLIPGGAGSASAAGTTVSVTAPALANGHEYAYSARADLGNGTISGMAAPCYLQISVGGQGLAAPTGAQGMLLDNTVYPASAGAVSWAGPVTTLVWQTDGNLVLYKKSGTPIWSSGTAGNPNAVLIFQNDGNLVIYQTMPLNKSDGSITGTVLWGSNSFGAQNMVEQTDGNAVIYGASGPLFGTNGNVQTFTDVAQNVCLDSSGGSVYTNPCNGGAYQNWVIIDDGDGSWQLKDSASGNCLDGNSTSVYANPCGSTNGYQRWNHTWGGSGWILTSQATGLTLDCNTSNVPYPNQTNSGNYQQWR